MRSWADHVPAAWPSTRWFYALRSVEHLFECWRGIATLNPHHRGDRIDLVAA